MSRVCDDEIPARSNFDLPEAFNTYDSLGEAYMTHGDGALAIANYQRSLELNPENANAVEMLKKLREQDV